MLYLRDRTVLKRIGLCILAAVAMWVMMQGWSTPFPYRTGYVPNRDVISRVGIEFPNEAKTKSAREAAKASAIFVYDHNPEALKQRRAELVNTVAKITTTPTLAELGMDVWEDFLPTPTKPTTPPGDLKKIQPAFTLEQKEETYQKFREALLAEGKLSKFKEDLSKTFTPLEQHGLLTDLEELDSRKGNQLEIQVRDVAQPEFPVNVPLNEVHLVEVIVKLQKDLDANLGSLEVAERVFTWLQKKGLPGTLKLNRDLSMKSEGLAEAQPKNNINDTVAAGTALAKAGQPLTSEKLTLLRLEDETVNKQTPFSAALFRSVAVWGMFLALYVLCGYYLAYRERRLFANLRRFVMLLGLVVLTFGLSLIAARDEWRAEMIPILLFGMTVAIAYQQEMALLMSAALALTVVIALGQSLAEFVILLSAASGAILMLGRIRSRSKLIYVGLCAAVVAGLTTIGIRLLHQHPLETEHLTDVLKFAFWRPGNTLQGTATSALLAEAGRVALWSVVAGFLMTGLLPFIENLFEVLTDISLLELGDIAHPLLQELVRRAPGTYNHSINVASISEAAAESIGAHGLLTRIGAYFHDIGKMLKPAYFVENQGTDGNRHESLLPAMSTLIIIAHIKDGADLARQHHLPQPIIDFIQQHHGTTLVEYFYRRANEQSENDPFAADVDENAFRYPGPKPQSKEAGVMMLADAVESASRTLVEPTPARIESLVHDMAMKRLLDGQFDECGLTLEEVHTIEDSLVKSLTAVYHGRVKYPEQRESREQRTA